MSLISFWPGELLGQLRILCALLPSKHSFLGQVFAPLIWHSASPVCNYQHQPSGACKIMSIIKQQAAHQEEPLSPLEPLSMYSPATSTAQLPSSSFEFDHPLSVFSLAYSETPVTTPSSSRPTSAEKIYPYAPCLQESSAKKLFFEKEFSPRKAKNKAVKEIISESIFCDDDGFLAPFSSTPPSTETSTFFIPRVPESRINVERNLRCSPAAGISSSVAVLKTNCPEELAHNAPYFTFNRTPTKINAHRRICDSSSSEPHLYSQVSVRKPKLPSLSISNSFLQWPGRRKAALITPSPTQNLFSSLFHVLSPSPTSSSSSQEDRAYSEKSENKVRVLQKLRQSNLSISAFLKWPIQFLISPFTAGLHALEHIFNSKISGSNNGHIKFRRRKFLGVIAIIYSVFSLVVFTHQIFSNSGWTPIHRTSSRALKASALVKKLDYLFYRKLNLKKPGGNWQDDWNSEVELKRGVHLKNIQQLLKDALNVREKNFLNWIPHTTRLSKLYAKSGQQFADETIPFLFEATESFDSLCITACLYTNQFWLEMVSEFATQWTGPISLVVESLSTGREELVKRIENLRNLHPLVKERVDFHLVITPGSLQAQGQKHFERMLEEPIATNAQINLARFFSRSDLVWLVGDARILPSETLHEILKNNTSVRQRLVDHNDAIVIPTFGFAHTNAYSPKFPTKDFGTDWANVGQLYVNQVFSSIPLRRLDWPKNRDALLNLATQASSRNSTAPVIAMHDEAWEPAEGPTNWTMWKQFFRNTSSKKLLGSNPKSDTLINMEVPGTQNSFYPVSRYSLDYSPNVLISKDKQAWCTERFEFNKAACIYQMYLTGTELWVMPEVWSFTLERIHDKFKKQSEKKTLKGLISSRLYNKFHQEACMHYGREVLSLGNWKQNRSRNLRALCSHVLNSWGVGIV